MSIVTFPMRGLNRMTPAAADKRRPAFARGETGAEPRGVDAPDADDDLVVVASLESKRGTEDA